MEIRKTRTDDEKEVFDLYCAVARIPGGLARLEQEVDFGYVQGFLGKAFLNGLSLVAVNQQNTILGEIHAYTPDLYCFSHVLSDLTIAVHPDHQTEGIGRKLFETFMDQVVVSHNQVSRIELIARESNEKAIGFYESLGFRKEGELRGRIKNLDGTLENDIPMAWQRD